MMHTCICELMSLLHLHQKRLPVQIRMWSQTLQCLVLWWYPVSRSLDSTGLKTFRTDRALFLSKFIARDWKDISITWAFQWLSNQLSTTQEMNTSCCTVSCSSNWVNIWLARDVTSAPIKRWRPCRQTTRSQTVRLAWPDCSLDALDYFLILSGVMLPPQGNWLFNAGYYFELAGSVHVRCTKKVEMCDNMHAYIVWPGYDAMIDDDVVWSDPQGSWTI